MAKIKDGTVKWFNEDKGYGFLQKDDVDDLFVHFRQVKNNYSIENEQKELYSIEIIENETPHEALSLMQTLSDTSELLSDEQKTSIENWDENQKLFMSLLTESNAILKKDSK